MSEKFMNKYRIPSSRLQTWDYGNEGAYFITICTNGRKQYFGRITGGAMILNDTGKMAERFWKEIPDQFPFIELDNFVIMPNHVHGILIIKRGTAETRLIASLLHSPCVSHSQFQPQPNEPGGVTGNKNPMFHNNISRIIRWYKGRCSFEINKIHPGFAWQTRFYDHIIRDAADRERIRKYITDNPANWKEGKSFDK